MHTLRKDKESALALVEEGSRRPYLANNSVEIFEYCSEINFTGSDGLKLIENRLSLVEREKDKKV